jgi:hypothetical protein
MTARDILGPFLAEPGPWTTVLADISRDVSDPRRTVDARLRSLLKSLKAQGAPEADRDAVEAVLEEDDGAPSPSARFLAIRAGTVEVDELLLGAIARDGWAWHAPVIDPLPLLARDAFAFHAVLVEAAHPRAPRRRGSPRSARNRGGRRRTRAEPGGHRAGDRPAPGRAHP